MNSAPISPGISAIFSALLSDYNPESAGAGPSAAASGIDFSELLNNQQDVGKLMQRLEKLLPPQDFERLNLAIEDGNSLPQAVTIAVGQLPDAGHRESGSPVPVAFAAQEQPLNTAEPQPLNNNLFPVSPGGPPADAGQGPFLQHNGAPASRPVIQQASSEGTSRTPPAEPAGPEQASRRQSTIAPQPAIKLPSSTLAGPQSQASGLMGQPTVSGAHSGPAAPAFPGSAPSAMTGQAVPNIRVPVSGMAQLPPTGEPAVPPQPGAVQPTPSGNANQSLPTDLPASFQSTIQSNSAEDPEGITAGLDRMLQQPRVSGPGRVGGVAPASPDLVNRTVIPEPVVDGRIRTGESLPQPGRVESAPVMPPSTAAAPAKPIVTSESTVAVTGIARLIQQSGLPGQNGVHAMPASSDKAAPTVSGEGGNAIRIPVAENLIRSDRAGSVAPSQPVRGQTVPATGSTSEPVQATGALARMLTQSVVSERSPVSMPRAAAGKTPYPEPVSQTVIDGGRTIPNIPVTDNLTQTVKQDLTAMQQFTTVMSTTTVAADQGAPASAASAISGGMGGAVSQTGGSLLQPGGPVNLNLEAPLGTRDWGEAVGERILWMVGRTIQGATLRVTPPHLGSIDIQLTMQKDQTNVSFTTQNGAVREALEAAIPRLREMFGESNLQLANVDVNQRQAEDQRGMSGNEGRDKGNGSEMGEDGHKGMAGTGNDPTSPNHPSDSNTDRLLDYYA